MGGVRVKLVDTAGERFGGEASPERTTVERRGQELARRRRGRADAFVLVVDGTVGMAEGERQLLDELRGTPVVVAWNKRDVAGPAAQSDKSIIIETSARTGEGLDELRGAIVKALGAGDEETGALVVGLRQKEALDSAAAALGRAAAVLTSAGPSELAAVEGREALNALGRVTGETVDAEVLDAIFSRFCIGK
jgi:tRNA modification GTPase